MADAKSSKTKYLLNLKFEGQEEGFGISGMDEKHQEIERQFLQDVAAYRAELEAKPESELDILIEVEEARVRQEQRHRPFFDQPSADADFAVWIGLPRWTSDQATALLLGKEPSIVHWARVEEHRPESVFARRYGQLKASLESSQTAGQLSLPGSPNDIVNWAREKRPRIPPALETTLPNAETRPPSRTGAPGRPSSMHIVQAEYLRRLEAGITEKSFALESEFLERWLRENHRFAPPLKPKSIKNNIGRWQKQAQN
jgi:hypothetical protein